MKQKLVLLAALLLPLATSCQQHPAPPTQPATQPALESPTRLILPKDAAMYFAPKPTVTSGKRVLNEHVISIVTDGTWENALERTVAGGLTIDQILNLTCTPDMTEEECYLTEDLKYTARLGAKPIVPVRNPEPGEFILLTKNFELPYEKASIELHGFGVFGGEGGGILINGVDIRSHETLEEASASLRKGENTLSIKLPHNPNDGLFEQLWLFAAEFKPIQSPVQLNITDSAFSPNSDGSKDTVDISISTQGKWDLEVIGVGNKLDGLPAEKYAVSLREVDTLGLIKSSSGTIEGGPEVERPQAA